MKEEEIQKAIEEGLSGNFLPIGIILALCGIVVFMFIFILKIYQKSNEKRHGEHDDTHEKHVKLMGKLSQSSINLEKMVAVHESEIKRLSA